MQPEVQAALVRYLLTLADDEIVLGYRDSEWTGVAPMVEEDIAFSSMAQDEIGHARFYYSLLEDLSDKTANTWALGRAEGEYYHARLLEHRATPKYHDDGQHEGSGDWAFAVIRRYLYDLFDDLRTEALLGSSYAQLAGAVKKIRREEHYHLKHGALWWKTLAGGSGDAHARFSVALERLWPDALGLFEDASGEDVLQAAGILTKRTSELEEAWLERVTTLLEPYNLPLPTSEARTGGRMGEHGEGWAELYHDMTMVYRLEPEGVW